MNITAANREYNKGTSMGQSCVKVKRRRRPPVEEFLQCLNGAVIIDLEWDHYGGAGEGKSTVMLQVMTYDLQQKLESYRESHANVDVVDQCRKNYHLSMMSDAGEGYSHSLRECCKVMIVILKFNRMTQGPETVITGDAHAFEEVMKQWKSSFIVGWFPWVQSAEEQRLVYRAENGNRRRQSSDGPKKESFIVERSKYTNKSGGILTLGSLENSTCSSYALAGVEMYLYQMSTRHADMPRLLADYLKKDSSSVG